MEWYHTKGVGRSFRVSSLIKKGGAKMISPLCDGTFGARENEVNRRHVKRLDGASSEQVATH